MTPPDQIEIERLVAFLEEMLLDLDDAITKWDGSDIDLTRALVVRTALGTCARSIALQREGWDSIIGEQMGQYRLTIEKVGVVERHHRTKRRNWDSDALLRTVLDTRVVDPDTGEIESQLDTIRSVWPLAGYQARTGALKARGIDPDEFCETETLPGWQLQVK